MRAYIMMCFFFANFNHIKFRFDEYDIDQNSLELFCTQMDPRVTRSGVHAASRKSAEKITRAVKQY